MADEVERLLTAGYEALAAGAWTTARDSLQVAVDREESAEALSGLANALWWLGEIGETVAYRERSPAVT